MQVWLNAIGYQVVWFCAVIGAGNGHAWPGVLAALGFIGWQMAVSRRRSVDLRLVIVALGCGCLVDGSLAASGLIDYAATWSPAFAPWWILGVWASFAMTLTHSMRFLQRSAWLPMLLGGIGGPMAYAGAAQGWQAMVFAAPGRCGVAALVVAWGIALPVLVALAKRWTAGARG